MKKIVFVFALLSLYTVSYAQKAKVVSAWNYLKYGELDKAKAAIDEATVNEASKDMPKTWCYRGLVYEAIAEKTDLAKLIAPDAPAVALEAFKKCMELDTKGEFKDEVFQQLGAISNMNYKAGIEAYNAKDFQKAYTSFNNVISIEEIMAKNNPELKMDTGAYMNTALAAEKMGNKEEAKKIYEKLVDMKYKDASVYQTLANMYKENKDTTAGYAAALAVLEKGLAVIPNQQALERDRLNIYLLTNQMQKAIEKLNEAIAKEPANAELQFNLGVAYENMKDIDKAEGAYIKATELNPNYFDANYNLGALYFNQAIEINKQMNKLDVSEQKKFDEMTLKRNAIFDKALPHFQKAQTINPNDESNNAAISKIKTITGK